MVEWSAYLSVGICTGMMKLVVYGPNKRNCSLTVNVLSGLLSESILIRKGHFSEMLFLLYYEFPLFKEEEEI